MIDPYRWQGRVTLQNMDDLAEAFRIRLASWFDIVQNWTFHKSICLAPGKAIYTWKHEVDDDGGINIIHNYGVYVIGGERSKETHGAYSIYAEQNYIVFGQDTIYIKPQESPYYVYIPRGES